MKYNVVFIYINNEKQTQRSKYDVAKRIISKAKPPFPLLGAAKFNLISSSPLIIPELSISTSAAIITFFSLVYQSKNLNRGRAATSSRKTTFDPLETAPTASPHGTPRVSTTSLCWAVSRAPWSKPGAV